MERQKESNEPLFDITDRDFNVKTWYLRDTENSKGDALVEIRKGKELSRQFVFPAYKIFNIAAHFEDIVDGELTKNKKMQGYNIAASTGFENSIIILPKEE